jgi:ABC-type nitrate/sulfonate/bicarbonate transport system permease component
VTPHRAVVCSGRIRSDALRQWLLGLVSFLVVFTAWEAWARASESLLLPSPSETISAMARFLGSASVWRALLVSNQALAIGFTASLVVGIPLGLAAGCCRILERALSPYLTVLLVTPMAALTPLFVMALGVGLPTRALTVFVFAAGVVIVNTMAGMRDRRPDLTEMARSFGASRLRLWTAVVLPGAAPAIMTAVRLGLARALSGMVVVELLLIGAGIGGLMLEFRATFDAPSLYGMVGLVMIEAVVLSRAARRLERRVLTWNAGR